MDLRSEEISDEISIQMQGVRGVVLCWRHQCVLADQLWPAEGGEASSVGEGSCSRKRLRRGRRACGTDGVPMEEDDTTK